MRRCYRAVVVAANIGAVMAISACTALGDTSEPAFLVNESNASLTVSVSMPPPEKREDGERALCRFDPRADAMKIGSVRDAYARRRLGSWPPAELINYDSDRCTTTVIVPAGMALLMFNNGTCSDYEKNLPNPVLKPTIARLIITGGSHRVDLVGFDAAMAFLASPSKHSCLYVLE